MIEIERICAFSYAGPGSQAVTDEFGIGFEEFLVSDQNYALVKIDGRGSNSRGWKYRSAIYKALGTVEIEDQVEAIRILMKKYPILDKTRLSIFGWSYGGFAAAKASEIAPAGFFKCAISVAPVANFLYYDATYTERYMGDAGKEAYNTGDILRNVSNFKTTRLLLVHGLYDDNVHFQHSALFMEALQMADIEFDLMYVRVGKREPKKDEAISIDMSLMKVDVVSKIREKVVDYLLHCPSGCSHCQPETDGLGVVIGEVAPVIANAFPRCTPTRTTRSQDGHTSTIK